MLAYAAQGLPTDQGSQSGGQLREFLHRDHLSIINQREIAVDTKSFSQALRSALRQDPDVILVGEMRDFETIETSLLAAETGLPVAPAASSRCSHELGSRPIT